MGFVSEIRDAFKAGEQVFKDAFKSNTITKSLLEESKVSMNTVGEIATDDFIHALRGGEIRNTFLEAAPDLADVLKKNKILVESMEREAKLMPEETLRGTKAEAAKVSERLPDIDKSAAAKDIEAEVAKDPEIKNMLEKIEKKATSGKTAKYLFLGAAVIGGGLTVYEALEAYARAKTGCFLYTKTDSGVTACKVLNASCLNPEPSDSIPACTTSDMGEALAGVSCDAWSESSDGACYHCDHKSFDESQLKNNQTLACIEKPSVSEAIGDLVYTSGESLVNGLGDIIKKVLYYGGIFLVIVVVIYAAIFLFRMISSLIRKQKRRREEEESRESAKRRKIEEESRDRREEDDREYGRRRQVDRYDGVKRSYEHAPRESVDRYDRRPSDQAASESVPLVAHHAYALATQSHALAQQTHALTNQLQREEVKKSQLGPVHFNSPKIAYTPPPYVATTTF